MLRATFDERAYMRDCVIHACHMMLNHMRCNDTRAAPLICATVTNARLILYAMRLTDAALTLTVYIAKLNPSRVIPSNPIG